MKCWLFGHLWYVFSWAQEWGGGVESTCGRCGLRMEGDQS